MTCALHRFKALLPYPNLPLKACVCHSHPGLNSSESKLPFWNTLYSGVHPGVHIPYLHPETQFRTSMKNHIQSACCFRNYRFCVSPRKKRASNIWHSSTVRIWLGSKLEACGRKQEGKYLRKHVAGSCLQHIRSIYGSPGKKVLYGIKSSLMALKLMLLRVFHFTLAEKRRWWDLIEKRFPLFTLELVDGARN